MSKFTEIKMRAYYDEKTGKIQLITKDRKLKNKPFQITLSRESSSVASLFELLESEGVITETYHFPTIVEYDKKESDKHLHELAKDHVDERLLFSIGTDGQKNLAHIDLGREPHTLICGKPGSGKSIFLRNMAHQIQDRKDTRLFVLRDIDIPGDYYSTQARYGDEYSSSIEEAFILCQKIEKMLDDRLNFIKEHEDATRWINIPGMHPVFILIDEIRMFSPSGVKNDEGKLHDLKVSYCMSIFDRISRLGQVGGFFMFAVTQRPDATLVPKEVKANFGRRMLFSADSRNVAIDDMVLDSRSDFAEILTNRLGRVIIRELQDEQRLIQTFSPIGS